MSVQLAPQLEAKVREKVEAGLYADADAVLREALRLLDEWDHRLQRLRDMLAVGEDGEAVPLTAELLAELNQSAMRRAEAGEMPHPDVCP